MANFRTSQFRTPVSFGVLYLTLKAISLNVAEASPEEIPRQATAAIIMKNNVFFILIARILFNISAGHQDIIGRNRPEIAGLLVKMSFVDSLGSSHR